MAAPTPMQPSVKRRSLVASRGVEVPLRRVGARGDRLGRAVERHRHDHDRDAAEDRERRVRVDAARDDGTEAAAADQAGDHDHREREQDRLVDAEQQHPAGERELHLRQHLAPGRAHRCGSLDGVRRHAADSERGDAHGWRDRVDHRRDDRCRRADREQDHHGHQVGERRHDLHRVEEGRDRRIEPIGAACNDPDRDPDEE